MRAPRIINRVAIFIFCFYAGCSFADQRYAGNDVAITGQKGSWGLVVNGKPFHLQGVGVGRASGLDGQIDYLKLAKDLGANCVRTWGINQGNEEYLARAHQYGLYVDAGIWINWADEKKNCSYVFGEECKQRQRQDTLGYVKKYKDHPSILFWNIGNEAIQFTKNEEERIALAKFLEELIREVKAIDPHHPVMYTSAYTTDVPYIAKYVPSLDILGVNIYGGFDNMHAQVTAAFDIPYIITEFGPPGPWDRLKDVNGRPIEATDESKTQNYRMLYSDLNKHRGSCLGGFAFHLGDTTQNSFTWWNLTYRQYKKLPYLAIQSFYTGKSLEQKIAHVGRISFSKQKDLKPNEMFDVQVSVSAGDGKKLHYQYFASTDIDHLPTEYPNVSVPLEVEGEGAEVKLTAPPDPGIYRIYVVVTDEQGHASSLSKTISVGP